MEDVAKEAYRRNRADGIRGQGYPAGNIVGHTLAYKVVQGAYGSRKDRRKVEAHGQGRIRRANNSAG